MGNASGRHALLRAKLVALDFDRTILKIHSCSGDWARTPESVWRYIETDAVVADPGFVRESIRTLSSLGVETTIASWGRRGVIEAVVNKLTPDYDWRGKILTPPDIEDAYDDAVDAPSTPESKTETKTPPKRAERWLECEPPPVRRDRVVPQKNSMLAELRRRFAVSRRSDVILVDDDANNLRAAAEVGYGTFAFATEGLTRVEFARITGHTSLAQVMRAARAEEQAGPTYPSTRPATAHPSDADIKADLKTATPEQREFWLKHREDRVPDLTPSRPTVRVSRTPSSPGDVHVCTVLKKRDWGDPDASPEACAVTTDYVLSKLLFLPYNFGGFGATHNAFKDKSVALRHPVSESDLIVVYSARGGGTLYTCHLDRHRGLLIAGIVQRPFPPDIEQRMSVLPLKLFT